MVHGQPVTVRDLLPSTSPDAFRAPRYYQTLKIAVQQREDEEQTQKLLAALLVQPDDGSMHAAGEQQRCA